jgi:YesK-like protein
MDSLVLITVVSSIILIYISLFFNKKGSVFQFVVPLITSLVSFTLIILGFIVGRWQGIGLGTIGLSLLVSSIIALIVISLVTIRKSY